MKLNLPRLDNKFFKHLWGIRDHRCEECGTWLGDKFQAIFCSHKLSKGAFPKIRWLNTNINILCPAHHRQWETGNRKGMKIYNEDELAGLRLLDRKLPEACWLEEDKPLTQ